MPSLRQLEYLVALADTRHFRRAAEKTNTTQPTLSEQLKGLEARLGVQLVERSSTGVVITPIGASIVEISRRMLRDVTEIRSIAASSAKDMGGVLRLGLPPTIGPYLLQDIIPKLAGKYPELKLHVREALPEHLPRELEDGLLDIIITPMLVKSDTIDSIVLFREPLLLAVARDHPLAEQTMVTMDDLAGADLLALSSAHQLHEEVISLTSAAGACTRLDYEDTSLDMLREIIATGRSITFMPGLYVRSELLRHPKVKTFEISDRSLFRTIGMAWRTSSARQHTFLQLAQLIQESIKF